MANSDDNNGMTKAYFNEEFIRSRDGRPMRILAEYLEPAARLEKYHVQDTIVFMGSARIPSQEEAEQELAEAKAGKGDLKTAEKRLLLSRYYEEARELAAKLTQWSKEINTTDRRFVICTGGGPGIMEAANRGASEARGVNLGFNISLPMEQHENPYMTRELGFEFHYFFMRKFWFAYLAKAVVIFPGGFGTLDELFEILTLLQTRKVKKPVPLVLYGTDYWRSIINLQALADWGTISQDDLELMHMTDSVDEAHDYLTRQLTAHALDRPGADL